MFYFLLFLRLVVSLVLHLDPQKKPLSDSFKKGKPLKPGKEDGCEEVRPANAPLIYARPADLQLPDHVLARRCNSKERGSIYDPILGICCHFCRSCSFLTLPQKKLCGEDNCLRCGNRDVEQPCLGWFQERQIALYAILAKVSFVEHVSRSGMEKIWMKSEKTGIGFAHIALKLKAVSHIGYVTGIIYLYVRNFS
ncbi:hypothetical protein EJ110_NYTH24343 [Nymphaea thermarum]|nr:hypothetical protein EJ110_NYTH24343 [Nymphaea thermarum]